MKITGRIVSSLLLVDKGDNIDVKRRVLLVNFIALLALIFLIIFACVTYIKGSRDLQLIHTMAIIVVLVTFAYIKRTHRFEGVAFINMFYFAGMFIYHFISGGIDGSGFLWTLLYPLIPVYILGSKRGFFVTLFFLMSLLFLYYVPLLPIPRMHYDTSFMIRFISTFLIIWLLAFYFEVVTSKMESLIQDSLKEKEVLLKEIHHRVKNNLSIISSLLSLQASNIEDRRIRAMFDDSQSRVRSMAMIHENLYKSKDLVNILAEDYIQSTTSRLIETYDTGNLPIELKVDCQQICLPVSKAVPCGLIINELLCNTLKYAFPPGFQNSPEIRISMTMDREEKITLIVADNGIGIKNVEDRENQDSLGLNLVKTLVESQLHGTMKLEQTAGTSYTIQFQLVSS